MAMYHAAPGELIDLHPLGEGLRQAVSETLVRSDHLEIFRLVLAAGKSLPEHAVPSVTTLQCLEGIVELAAHGRSCKMRAGSLVYLAPGEAHALKALEDSAVLVTLLVHRD
jgi:quercetin dioxygenase-like cupin family protein